MLEVSEQVRRYAEAAERAVPPERTPMPRRPPRALVAAGLVVMLGAAAIVAASLRQDETAVVSGPGAEEVPVPAQGASPEQLDDGTPVWVVRHDDGSVSVLDAVSTHTPFGAGHLVGWCPGSEGFEDPAYGSQFDAWGRVRGGPAPAGLPAYRVTDVGTDAVTVVRPPVRQPRGGAGGSDATPPAGPGCFDDDPGADLVPHPVRQQHPATLDEAITAPDGTLVMVQDAPILIRQGQPAIVCATGLEETNPPSCTGPQAVALFLPLGDTWAVLHGTFIARLEHGTLTHIAYVTEFTAETSSPTSEGEAPVGDDPVVATPSVAAAGDLVELTYPTEILRGSPWYMSKWDGEQWSEPLYLLISTAPHEPGDPTWYARSEGWGWEDIGRTGPGPDIVQIPEVAEPGTYRLCTANTGDDTYCVNVTVSSDTEPSAS